MESPNQHQSPDLNIGELTKKKDINETDYASLLDVYVKEVKRQERMDKERQRMFLMEKSFSHSIFDLIFPYHMYLGHLESQQKQALKKKK